MNTSVLANPHRKGQGSFLLPEIPTSIPSTLAKSQKKRSALARFVLAGEACGVPLPGGEFNNMESVAERQWQSYADTFLADCRGRDILNGEPSFLVEDERFTIMFTPTGHVDVMVLKPVITQLESISPGLGWYVVNQISRATQHGLNFYDLKFVGNCAFFDTSEGVDDVSFMKNYIEEETGEKPSSISPEEEERIRSECNIFPSDYLAAAGGHRHLLGWEPPKGEKNPKVATTKEVVKALKSKTIPKDMKECLGYAHALQLLFDADAECAFGWYDGIDESEPVGAAGMVIWDEFDVPWETIQHHEEDLFNSGQGTEGLGRMYFDLSASDSEYQQKVQLLLAYFARWKALGNLLACFPEKEIP